jgi:hypothetical protein
MHENCGIEGVSKFDDFYLTARSLSSRALSVGWWNRKDEEVSHGHIIRWYYSDMCEENEETEENTVRILNCTQDWNSHLPNASWQALCSG